MIWRSSKVPKGLHDLKAVGREPPICYRREAREPLGLSGHFLSLHDSPARDPLVETHQANLKRLEAQYDHACPKLHLLCPLGKVHMGALKWGLMATLCNSRTIICKCAHLWTFGPTFGQGIPLDRELLHN